VKVIGGRVLSILIYSITTPMKFKNFSTLLSAGLLTNKVAGLCDCSGIEWNTTTGGFPMQVQPGATGSGSILNEHRLATTTTPGCASADCGIGFDATTLENGGAIPSFISRANTSITVSPDATEAAACYCVKVEHTNETDTTRSCN